MYSKPDNNVSQNRQFRKLSNRDREIFLAMLDADGKSNKKLIEIFEAHRELIAE